MRRNTTSPPSVSFTSYRGGASADAEFVQVAELIPRGGVRSSASKKRLRGRTLPTRGQVLLGRCERVHLVISDPSVSRRHARIEAFGGRFWLVDLKSANGSSVNGLTVKRPTELRDGDLLRLGSTVFSVSVRRVELRRPQAQPLQQQVDPHEDVTRVISREELLAATG